MTNESVGSIERKLIEKLIKENEQLKEASEFWRLKYLREIGAKDRKGEMRGEVERKGD
ncbi:hypothetical protein NYE67_20580 [Solibacillus sp. FSL W8-0474]|uniref:hypothetical protein n=1 Tax=Solibacillus sp. FSL W8-0474 TaxID=2975336 RepID=UPI0030FC369A